MLTQKKAYDKMMLAFSLGFSVVLITEHVVNLIDKLAFTPSSNSQDFTSAIECTWIVRLILLNRYHVVIMIQCNIQKLVSYSLLELVNLFHLGYWMSDLLCLCSCLDAQDCLNPNNLVELDDAWLQCAPHCN